jgi:hypothetical protein
MSIGSLGNVAASASGAPLAQTKGSDVERAQHDVSAQQRVVESNRKAEAASGIGETDGEDHQPGERDADGRRPWQLPAQTPNTGQPPAHESPPGKDTSGRCGNLLDLSG